MKRGKNGRERPDYGLDAPYVVLTLLLGGVACLVVAVVSTPMRWLYTPAISLLATSAVWIYGSKIGKLRLREQLLDRIDWTGHETVLDVGCGSGLLLNAAAKRLKDGTAIGVDLWRTLDLARNQKETTLRNAALEGVADHVEVDTGDARCLPFADAAFDIVVSLNVLHNMGKRRDRAKALTEISRVLKPGGIVLLADFRNAGEYAAGLRANGVTDSRKERIGWVLFFPVFAAVGTKGTGAPWER